MNKLDFIKIKNDFFAKDTVKTIKRQSKTQRKYQQNTYIEFAYKIYKELLELSKKTAQFKK